MALLRSISHSNVLQFCGVVYRDGRLHLITEFIGGGTLESIIRESSADSLPYVKRVSFAKDIATGMDYLHARGIIHRDLNSHNCLVREVSGSLCSLLIHRSCICESEFILLCKLLGSL